MTSIAGRLADLLPPVLGVRAWDGSYAGPPDATATVVIRTPRALTRLLYAPHELGLGRAYVSGDLDVEGDLYAALAVLRDATAQRPATVIRTAVGLGAVRLPVRPPAEEARLKGLRHSRKRDAEAIAHHYDLSNDFYRIVLGPTMAYSCALWPSADAGLDAAQVAKLDLVCRKLGLRPGMRLLDVGCGWGGLVLHAAERYGVTAVGITISRRQYDLARQRVTDAGLAGRVEIRLQDYREVTDGPYHAIASIGMAEHVGTAKLLVYATRLHTLLAPGGRLLNHAIARRPGKPGNPRRSFIAHYVFPDGDLLPLDQTVHGLEASGLEVRDVEALREHYALTLRAWVANLEAGWDDAVRLVGPARARIWRLYLAASALSFEAGAIGVNQVLAVRSESGRSGLPLTRSWLAEPARTLRIPEARTSARP